MLLPVDWACAVQETPASTMTRMSDEHNEIHIGNFSHSEKAELRPELMVCDMDPLGNCWLSDALDAYGCAAAGQKLTLDKGLGKEKSPQKAKAEIAPCPRLLTKYLTKLSF